MDWLYYCWTTILNKSESEFWSSTLKKINSQIDILINLNNRNEKKSSKLKVLD